MLKGSERMNKILNQTKLVNSTRHFKNLRKKIQNAYLQCLKGEILASHFEYKNLCYKLQA